MHTTVLWQRMESHSFNDRVCLYINLQLISLQKYLFFTTSPIGCQSVQSSVTRSPATTGRSQDTGKRVPQVSLHMCVLDRPCLVCLTHFSPPCSMVSRRHLLVAPLLQGDVMTGSIKYIYIFIYTYRYIFSTADPYPVTYISASTANSILSESLQFSLALKQIPFTHRCAFVYN